MILGNPCLAPPCPREAVPRPPRPCRSSTGIVSHYRHTLLQGHARLAGTRHLPPPFAEGRRGTCRSRYGPSCKRTYNGPDRTEPVSGRPGPGEEAKPCGRKPRARRGIPSKGCPTTPTPAGAQFGRYRAGVQGAGAPAGVPVRPRLQGRVRGLWLRGAHRQPLRADGSGGDGEVLAGLPAPTCARATGPGRRRHCSTGCCENTVEPARTARDRQFPVSEGMT